MRALWQAENLTPVDLRFENFELFDVLLAERERKGMAEGFRSAALLSAAYAEFGIDNSLSRTMRSCGSLALLILYSRSPALALSGICIMTL
jgi:hypothetical protein